MTGTPVERRAVAAVVARPGLWPTAVRVGLALAEPGWWRRWPPRPLPSDDYLRFRLHTMFGASPDARLGPADVVGLLEWCRRERLGRR